MDFKGSFDCPPEAGGGLVVLIFLMGPGTEAAIEGAIEPRPLNEEEISYVGSAPEGSAIAMLRFQPCLSA